ncbi:hypothetical protein GCM10011583_71660 [Streptomyces camponoticapitis]|uniref:Pierisin-like domain-containing protein n=2 Tax=Streptomyces camponoticapitis TaxID=1616125 RepID=A0ABQ2EWL5_9ACTN|nr:hypothetical protein GCM10011583_71660 [Streptomyces camponoticapitis]
MFALTLLGTVDVRESLLVLGTRVTPALSLAALYAVVPGIVAVVLARRLWTGGKVVWFVLMGLQASLLIGGVVNPYAGSSRGVSQMLLSGVLLALVSVGASRAWFELPAEQRAVRPRWRIRRLKRDGKLSVPHLITGCRNRGQSTVEYVGMVGLVALIVGALMMTGVGSQVAGGLQRQVCDILGGDCESSMVGQDAGEAGGVSSGGGGSTGGGDSEGDDSGGGNNGGGDSGGGSDGGGDSGGSNGPVADPRKNPHVEVAVKDVDLAKLPKTTKWRDTDEPLYLLDDVPSWSHDRPRHEVFTDGFQPKNPDNMDLYGHVDKNTESAFVSTTTKEKPVPYNGQDYMYEIDAPGGIDINGTFGNNSPHPNEDEIAFPGGIDLKYIKGAWELDDKGNKTGYFKENIHYEPPYEPPVEG